MNIFITLSSYPSVQQCSHKTGRTETMTTSVSCQTMLLHKIDLLILLDHLKTIKWMNQSFPTWYSIYCWSNFCKPKWFSWRTAPLDSAADQHPFHRRSKISLLIHIKYLVYSELKSLFRIYYQIWIKKFGFQKKVLTKSI